MSTAALQLNIAAICTATRVLGPGSRFAIWVQGCCFACANCSAPKWREMKEATLYRPEVLASMVLNTPGVEGVTISGGEPLLQAAALAQLIASIRSVKHLSVICFTGFTLEELRSQKDAHIDDLLGKIDVLIDGPYVDSLNDNQGLRGSTNQRIHFFSGVYRELVDEFIHSQRNIEIHLLPSKKEALPEYLIAGIKPKGMNQPCL